MEQTALRPRAMPGSGGPRGRPGETSRSGPPPGEPGGGSTGPGSTGSDSTGAAKARGRRLGGALCGLLCAVLLLLAGIGLGTVGTGVIGMGRLAETTRQDPPPAGPGPAAPPASAAPDPGAAPASPPPVRGGLGVEVVDAPKGAGALVVAVHVPGPGNTGGLARGDVLVALGDQRVGSALDLAAHVADAADARPGRQLVVTVRHIDGQLQKLAVTPGVVT
ncbi:PDZ domain-containing protein [Streptomyces sp. BYX5S]